jgi:hypothetical protein
VRHCKRCHRPGHIARLCDVDIAEARVQDIAAACLRLGLSPPPTPRAPLPTLPPAPRSGSAWDRADPDQDLTDLEPAAAPTEPVAVPALDAGPTSVAPPPPLSLVPGGADPTAIQARLRARLRVINGHVRAKTVAAIRLHRDERLGPDELLDPSAYDRPLTRGDCELDGENERRPCPWASCSFHLALDVDEKTGALKINFPHLEIWEMPVTCALDVADRGGVTLDEVGKILNVTRERTRQIEAEGLAKIKRRHPDAFEDPADRGHSPLGEVMDNR